MGKYYGRGASGFNLRAFVLSYLHQQFIKKPLIKPQVDTSLFSVVHNLNTSTNNLNEDLKNNDWATLWKMSFNPNPTTQAQEVIFSRKIKKSLHIPLNFKQTAFQKDLGLILDSQLSFEEHLKTIFSKANKTIGLIRKQRNSLPRPFLMTLYKSFIRPHLDYGDIIYDSAIQ